MSNALLYGLGTFGQSFMQSYNAARDRAHRNKMTEQAAQERAHDRQDTQAYRQSVLGLQQQRLDFDKASAAEWLKFRMDEAKREAEANRLKAAQSAEDTAKKYAHERRVANIRAGAGARTARAKADADVARARGEAVWRLQQAGKPIPAHLQGVQPIPVAPAPQPKSPLDRLRDQRVKSEAGLISSVAGREAGGWASMGAADEAQGALDRGRTQLNEHYDQAQIAQAVQQSGGIERVGEEAQALFQRQTGRAPTREEFAAFFPIFLRQLAGLPIQSSAPPAASP